ncbi:MAG: putative selenium-dependent hydroxylase accessory protein YqeC [Treponema sp.]|jgi:probable selenium-dependent hydroxylase accessory protein YqeC|nr:putative selenium-dependent hydroxylase accessory protein YqeC [Treponema sp.]
MDVGLPGIREIVISFRGARDAILGERKLLDAGIDVRIMPMPGRLGPACGICLRVNPGDIKKAQMLLGGTILGMYRAEDESGRTFVPWNVKEPVYRDFCVSFGAKIHKSGRRLSAWFEKELFPPDAGASCHAALTVIGSGGKTSLINLIAQRAASREKRVLVTTTTKIRMIEGAVVCGRLPHKGALLYRLKNGVTVAGCFNEQTGKLESPDEEDLAEIAPSYNLVLIEGDGSRMLPLKAWAEHEPVVPPCTTHTVGVIPLWPLGKPVSAEIIHRLPLFSALTGAAEGERLTLDHLVRVICGNDAPSAMKDGKGRSLFSAAVGRKILFFNQIEAEPILEKARELAALLPEEFRSGLYGVIAGSVRQDRVRPMGIKPEF